MPYTKSLEAAALPQPHDIVQAVKRVLNVKWWMTNLIFNL
jgi:pyruvate/2-oxoglutarate/acetoin dehydrogenase E1 component